MIVIILLDFDRTISPSLLDKILGNMLKILSY